MKNRAIRHLLGVAALACLATGGVVFARGGEANGSVFLRSGLVLAAVWFAWPLIIRVDRRWAAPLAVGVMVALLRPALLLWLVPLLIALGLLRRRSAPSPRRPR